MAYSGLGTVDQTCGKNSHFNTSIQKCECVTGFDWVNFKDDNNLDCVPGCGDGKFISKIDGTCYCPPGQIDLGKGCVSASAFPDCVDKNGKSVPDCFLGWSLDRTWAPLAVGLAGGLILGAIVASAIKR